VEEHRASSLTWHRLRVELYLQGVVWFGLPVHVVRRVLSNSSRSICGTRSSSENHRTTSCRMAHAKQDRSSNQTRCSWNPTIPL